MSGVVASNSPMRSIDPPAREISLHTSVNPPSDPAANTAYNTNWPSTPALMLPSITARAPAHSTSVIAPKMSRMTSAVKPGALADATLCRFQRARDGAVIAVFLDRLADVGLNRIHRIERFVGDGGSVGDAVLIRARQFLLTAPSQHDRQDHQRNDQRGIARKLRTRQHQHHRTTDGGDDTAQRDGHARADDGLHEFGIGAES